MLAVSAAVETGVLNRRGRKGLSENAEKQDSLLTAHETPVITKIAR